LVEFHPFGSFFITGSSDTNMKIWDPRSGKCVQTYRGHRSGISAVAFSPHGKWVVSGDRDGVVKFWDIATGKIFANIEHEHSDSISSISFHPNDFYLITGSVDRTAKLWSCESDISLAVSSDPADSPVDRVLFRPDGSSLYVVHQDKSLREFKCDLENQQIASVGECLSEVFGTGEMLDLSFSKSRNCLVGLLKTEGNTVRVCDLMTSNSTPICTPSIVGEETLDSLPPPPVNARSISSVLESRLLTTRTVCALVNRGNYKEALYEAVSDMATLTSLLTTLIQLDRSRECISVELCASILEMIKRKSLVTLPFTESQAVVDEISRLPFSSPGMIKKVGCRESCDSANFSSTVTCALNVIAYLFKKFVRNKDEKCMPLFRYFARVLEEEVAETKFMRNEKHSTLSHLIQ
jgi:hypothetical protein